MILVGRRSGGWLLRRSLPSRGSRGGFLDKRGERFRVDVCARKDDSNSPPFHLQSFPHDRTDCRGPCRFGDESFFAQDSSDGFAQLVLRHENHPIDQGADDVEGDGVGIEVAAQSISKSLTDVDVDDAAGSKALFERT